MTSLYLHIPFCLRKCHYCDFFSADSFSSVDLDEYVALLVLELRQLTRKYPAAPPLQTVFFGGGTPSLLTVSQVDFLLRRLEKDFGLSTDCEISLEANPGTLDQAQLDGYRQAGVNRLSLGIQSLDERCLQLLGRIHSAAEARRAVDMARAAGFDNLNLDLMFALPGQSLEALQQDLEGLLALQPQHLSLYGLTFEPGTALAERLQRGELTEIDEQGYIDSYLLLNHQLSTAGFEHYEISNFARPGYRCRHNQGYWQRRTCLALGCGAHSFVAADWGERWHVPADLPAYRQKLLSGKPASELLETFDRRTAMAETVYLALRTTDGVARAGFKQRFGVFPEEAFSATFRRHPAELIRIDDCWRFDLQGWLLYDHLISSFL